MNAPLKHRAAEVLQAIDELNREQVNWTYEVLAKRSGCSTASDACAAVGRLKARGLLREEERLVKRTVLVTVPVGEVA